MNVPPVYPELETTHLIRSENSYYRVIQRLGSGGNSHVYLVETLQGAFRGLLFALKLFVRVNDATRLGRFNKEVDFLNQCSHPSIMKVYDRGEMIVPNGGADLRFPFVIVEYLPETLEIAMQRGLPVADKLAFALQLLSGLSYLGARAPQVVHRDIKPENVFVRGKSCILGDFGLMKLIGDGSDDPSDPFIHSDGPRLPRFYRSPDLVLHSKNKVEITTKSDVFQLGLVLARLFTGSNPLKRCRDILDDVELDGLLHVGGSQSAAITALLEKMLELNPVRRPAAEDLIDPWEGIFLEVVKMSHQLEGRVF